MIREISISESWAAIDVQSGTTIDKADAYTKAGKKEPGTTRDPVPILCRKLKALGIAVDDDIVQVTRDGMKVFNELPLSWWAERDCVESRNGSVRWQKYVPFPGVGD